MFYIKEKGAMRNEKEQEKQCDRRTRFPGGGSMSRLHSSRTGIFVAVCGLLMAGYGIYRGEISVVLEKAINICMECIGIG